MSMRRRLLVLLLLLLTTACGPSTRTGADGPTPTPTPVIVDPMSLIGWWDVMENGKEAGVLRIGDELTLFLACGALDSGWRASPEGLFVAHSSSGDSACFTPSGPMTPAWLEAAAGFRGEGSDRVLVDRSGERLVTLSPGKVVPVGPNRSADVYGSDPLASPALAARMTSGAPLPAGVDPATTTALVDRRWQAPDNDKAFLEFHDDGSYTGSDGCNGAGGRFALGAGGELMTVTGGSTLIGCNNSQAPLWLSETKRAGIVAGQLVLVDGNAKELGRLKAA